MTRPTPAARYSLRGRVQRRVGDELVEVLRAGDRDERGAAELRRVDEPDRAAGRARARRCSTSAIGLRAVVSPASSVIPAAETNATSKLQPAR